MTVTVEGPVWTGADQAACSSTVDITLSSPLNGRAVIDGVNSEEVRPS